MLLHVLAVLCVLIPVPALAGVDEATAVLRGRVIDFKTGEAVSKAEVAIRSQGLATATDEDGRFALPNARPGEVELSVTTVGYGLLKKRIVIAAGSTVEVELLIGQEALKHSEQVTVAAAGPFAPVTPGAATEYTLSNTEIRNLSTALAEDPFRAIHNLPGVTASDDFYSQFAVRGADVSHIGVFLDGVLVDQPFHAVRDQGDLGSLSIINGDVVESTALLSGAFPARFGDRTGAVLDVTTRDGGRDRISTRLNLNFMGASATVEGPAGSKASWLVSARKSYLEYLLNRIDAGGQLKLGYEDVQGKLAYDFSAGHRVSVTALWGGAQASRNPLNYFGQALNYFDRAHSRGDLATARWNWIASPSTLFQTQGFWNQSKENDRNPQDQPLVDYDARQAGFREDLTRQFGSAHKLEAGFIARRLEERFLQNSLWDYPNYTMRSYLVLQAQFTRDSWNSAAYVQDNLDLLDRRLTLRFGGRWERFNRPSQDAWLPHVSITLAPVRRARLSLSAGQYAQFPGLEELYGQFGNPDLRAERSSQAVAAFDLFITDRIRVHAEAYDREERSIIYSPWTEFRLLPGAGIVLPRPGPVLDNSLRGYARGFEISLHRRSANRLAGWISYARGYSKDWQPGTTLSYWGDFDSRNTVTAYASARITPSVNLSASARYASGHPIPGFISGPLDYTIQGTKLRPFQLTSSRNVSRLPSYQNIGLRASKTTIQAGCKMTVYGEVSNVLNHKNWRYYYFVIPPSIRTDGLVGLERNQSMPLLPAAGLTLEF